MKEANEMRESSGFRLILAVVCLICLWVCDVPLLQAQGTVDQRTGRLDLAMTDMAIQAGPVFLLAERSLQQGTAKKGMLGIRWRMNWEISLAATGNSVIVEEAGIPDLFRPTGWHSIAESVGYECDH